MKHLSFSKLTLSLAATTLLSTSLSTVAVAATTATESTPSEAVTIDDSGEQLNEMGTPILISTFKHIPKTQYELSWVNLKGQTNAE